MYSQFTPSGTLPAAVRKRLAALWRDETGAAAIEYAFVGPMFIMLVLGILHVALIYLAEEALETAVEGAARLINTGAAQTLVVTSGASSHTGMNADDFKTSICNGISGKDVGQNPVNYPGTLPPFLTCGRLAVNVAIAPDGCIQPTITMPTPTFAYNDATGTWSNTGTSYGTINCDGSVAANGSIAGSQGRLAIVQLAYLWPTIKGMLGLDFSSAGYNNSRLIVQTYVVNIEHYTCATGSTTPC